MSRVDDLRADYEALGELLKRQSKGSDAAAIVRERRAIGLELERLETPEEVSRVDQLAAKRAERRGNESTGARRNTGRGAFRH